MTRYAVIMAGGAGERFWPASRQSRPKQLLKLTHPEETLLEEAVNRIMPLVGHNNVLIATGTPLEQPIREADLLPADAIIVEPDRRNTLGCLCWVAANLMARHPDHQVSMAVLTADHKIGHPEAFRQTVDRALTSAEATGGLLTLGVVPTRPETGYGYIEMGEGEGVRRVASFREKPELELAKEFVASGHFLWNSGMFFWTLDGFLRELSQASPESHAIVLEMAASLSSSKVSEAVEAFSRLPNKSIDFALMEKAKEVYTIPADFPWDDVGAWDALERSLETDLNGSVHQGSVVSVDSRGTIVVNESPGMLVATIGVEDLIVVVTKDDVLICPKDQAQRVKELLPLVPESLK